MRYALTFLLMATIALGQGVWPKTATVVDGGHRYDFDTLGKRSVTPSADYGNMLLWQAFSYSDNSDADFYDLSTSANDGAQGTAAAQPTWSSADGGVYDFDGVDDYIDMDSTTGIANSATRSVFMWIKTDTAANGALFGTTKSAVANFRDQWIVLNGKLRHTVDTDGANQLLRLGTSVVTNDVWMHVGFTWDGTLNNTGVKVYVNATEEGTGGQNGTGSVETESADNVIVGARLLWGNASLFYEGLMDDARVYTSVLTATEVLAIADNTGATYYPYFSGFTESFDTYSDLALWMPFTSDETPDYIDKGPIGNDGSQTTAASQPTWSSADGGVYDFDGVDDFIEVADADSLSFGDGSTDSPFSLSAWVFPNASGERLDIFTKRTTGGGEEWAFEGGSLTVFTLLQSTPSIRRTRYSTAQIATGTWSHVVGVYDGRGGTSAEDGVSLYVNGAVLTSTLTDTAGTYVAMINGAAPVRTGTSEPDARFANGKIDDTRVYSTALTAAQILAIADNTGATYYPYFSGFTESFDTYADLALWMPFTSDETPDYIDKGPIGNDGSQTTAASQPTWSSADGGTYSFDGVDDTIHIDDLPSAVSSDTVGAIMLWMKPTTAPPAGTEVMFSFGDTSANAFLHFQRQATGKFLCSIRKDPTTSGWQVQTTSTTVFSSGTWTHVALVQNGTRPLFYIDGTLAATADDVTTDLTAWVGDIVGMDNARVACRSYGGGGDANFFDGDIDDVRMYDRVLTATEILAIKNNTQH